MEQLKHNNSEVNGKLNQMDDEKTSFERSIAEERRKSSGDLENEKIPEIKDIYDHIYGNVKNKRVFYESKQFSVNEETKKRANSICSSPGVEEIKNISQEFEDLIQEKVNFEDKICVEENTKTSEKINIPKIDEPNPEEILKTEKLNIQKIIDERTEILNEINANLKLELDRVKQQLKLEISKTNSLNFEIANIESILETYYKEASHPKSTLSAIYSAMKYYVVDEKTESQESYTFKRMKAISDYVEILKHKFEHQDRIIKNNFIENPYYSDLMIRHEATRKQLDEISLENQKLKEDLKSKETQELDTIKELNRQKFEIEKNYKEMDEFYKEKMTENAIFVENIKEECNQKLKNFEYVLEKSKEDKVELKKACEAKLYNYQQEVAIVYSKWNKFKLQRGEKFVPNIEL